jgi:hypothetical protein
MIALAARTLFLRAVFPLRRIAEIGLVRLDHFALTTKRREIETATPHGFHDPVMEKPSGVVLTAQLAM